MRERRSRHRGIHYLSSPAPSICSRLASAFIVAPAFAQNVTGAGASFSAPLYAKWAGDFNKATGTQVNYQSVGSGAGLKQIKAKTVDFGASDMPLTDDELKAKGLMQFPTVIGGVVPVVNIAGIKPGELKLSGAVLGDIYLGKITKWNDAAIESLNGSLALPDAAIAPVRRADGSGTSFLFTNYLSKVNTELKTKVGEGTESDMNSAADPRIKAAVVAAPALGFTFSPDGLKNSRCPCSYGAPTTTSSFRTRATPNSFGSRCRRHRTTRWFPMPDISTFCPLAAAGWRRLRLPSARVPSASTGRRFKRASMHRS